MQEGPTATRLRRQSCRQLRRILPENGYETFEVNCALKGERALRHKPPTSATMVIVRKRTETTLPLLRLNARLSLPKSGFRKFALKLLLPGQDAYRRKMFQMMIPVVEMTVLIQLCLSVPPQPALREHGYQTCPTDKIVRVGGRSEKISLTMILLEAIKKALETLRQILRSDSATAADESSGAGFR